MKNLYYVASFMIVIAFTSCSSSRYYQSNPDGYTQNYDQQQMITYQQFYNDLSPYGDWINYGNYGYVWVPYQANFRPYYSNGYWVYTNYGWTWVSNYNWGWAPFHYGRWINDMRFGWMWVPGYEWAPAWVAWRGGGDYYGWAPLAPGMDMNMNYGSIPYTDWTFVPRHYINSPRINNYYLNQSRNNIIINNTTIINNNTIINNQNNGTRRANYNPGPPVREVEQTTGTRIRRYNLVTTNKPEGTQVSNSSVRLFRPTVQQQPASSNPRPEKVKNLDEIRATHSAPVREFPKDQTPQVIKDEPPVRNNPPQVIPERNNTQPARVFPKTNENPPAENRPVSPQNRNNPPAENRPVTPNPQNQNNPPADNRPQENKPTNNPPVRTFPNHPTPPVTEKPVEHEIRKTTPANDEPQVNPQQNNKPVRTFSNPQPAKQNEYKQQENQINERPASTPAEVRKRDEQPSRPAPQPRPQINTPSRQPVRRVVPTAVPSPQPQNQQKDEKHDERVRTFNPQKK